MLTFVHPEAEAELHFIFSPKKESDSFSDTAPAEALPDFIKLPFNILQTDENDIHLYRDIIFDPNQIAVPPKPSYSRVLCQEALTQNIPHSINQLARMQRLNMIAQVPELGVVIIGNQTGRVGILTMTRWEAARQSGYKIEAILPFKSEEGKGLRPRAPLMGIAVGPVQGFETRLPRDSPRMGMQGPMRFRLLMTYCDHTILSYEISRPDGEENIIVV